MGDAQDSRLPSRSQNTKSLELLFRALLNEDVPEVELMLTQLLTTPWP